MFTHFWADPSSQVGDLGLTGLPADTSKQQITTPALLGLYGVMFLIGLSTSVLLAYNYPNQDNDSRRRETGKDRQSQRQFFIKGLKS